MWWRALALITAVGIVYGNSLTTPFLFDDAGAVEKNASIRSFATALSPPADGSTTTGRPVVNLSFALNYTISGERVWSYHVTNIGIHALAALLLMGVLRRSLLTSVVSARFGTAAAALSFWTALLWALHPLQTETVVGIAQRTESLCALFLLLALYAFIRATSESGVRRSGFLTLSITSSLAGMGCKEVMATAPLLILLYDRTFLSGTFARAWQRHRTWHLALAATWLPLAALVWSGGVARGASAGFGLGITSWDYLLQQSEAILTYLKLAIWPDPLVLDYGTAVPDSWGDVWWQCLFVGSLVLAAIWALARRPVIGFLGASFFVLLAPSSSIIPLVTQTVAEHRMYLPLAVVVILISCGFFRWQVRIAYWALAMLALVLGGVTVARNHDYRSAVAIWTDTIAHAPDNPRAHNNLATALHTTGETGRANVHFHRAVALDPDYVGARFNFGSALLQQRDLPAAITHLSRAVDLAPDHVDARVNLGTALVQAQRAEEAIPHFEAALALRPTADVHFNLGIALVAVQRPRDATKQFLTALQLQPHLPEAHFQLGRIAEQSGDPAAAQQRYTQALQLAPDHLETHRRLGLMLAREGQLSAAEEHFRTVVRFQPEDADASANLGNTLLLQGRPREAVAAYEQSLRLRPDDQRTRENLRLARESLR